MVKAMRDHPVATTVVLVVVVVLLVMAVVAGVSIASPGPVGTPPPTVSIT
jgi:hypothetical protein